MNSRPPLSTAAIFGLLLAAYLTLGALYAVYTPLWQIPDEPAHFNYVKHLAEQRRLPVLQQGDYPAAYLEEIKAHKFPPDMSVDPIRYEFYQPPLYYGLAATIYVATASWPLSSQVVALRLLSVLLGTGVLWLAYRIVCEIFLSARPDRFSETCQVSASMLALGTAAFAAAVPMHIAMTAAVNNDALAELILAGILYLGVRITQREASDREWVGLGALVGLGLLTKGTTYIAIPLVLAILYIGLRRSEMRGALAVRRSAKAFLLVFGSALILSGGWFLRNGLVYGLDDPLAWKRHTQVVAGQLTTAEYLARHGWRGWVGDFLATTFRSFWGQFGWMGVPMDRRVYLFLGLLSGLVALGLVLLVIRQWRDGERRGFSPGQLWALALAALSLLLTVAQYLWLNRQFVQFQGRYLFSSIIPLGLAFALGLAEILRRGYETWVGALLGGGALIAALKGLQTGGPDKWLIALLAAGAAGFLVKRTLPARFAGLFVALVYIALLALSAASPFLFIVPYLHW